ncbi:hypothetical protein MUP46_03705 [Patescibacteria group bacterium]|nr:hypothetical protein [Patescibacteria group bacterium]
MNQSEFEKRQAAFENRRAAQVQALRAMQPAMKVIELIEELLKENPSLPVTVEIGSRQFSITSVKVDEDGKVRIRV